jgi:hypothetical protein
MQSTGSYAAVFTVNTWAMLKTPVSWLFKIIGGCTNQYSGKYHEQATYSQPTQGKWFFTAPKFGARSEACFGASFGNSLGRRDLRSYGLWVSRFPMNIYKMEKNMESTKKELYNVSCWLVCTPPPAIAILSLKLGVQKFLPWKNTIQQFK